MRECEQMRCEWTLKIIEKFRWGSGRQWSKEKSEESKHSLKQHIDLHIRAMERTHFRSSRCLVIYIRFGIQCTLSHPNYFLLWVKWRRRQIRFASLFEALPFSSWFHTLIVGHHSTRVSQPVLFYAYRCMAHEWIILVALFKYSLRLTKGLNTKPRISEGILSQGTLDKTRASRLKMTDRGRNEGAANVSHLSFINFHIVFLLFEQLRIDSIARLDSLPHSHSVKEYKKVNHYLWITYSLLTVISKTIKRRIYSLAG